MTAVTVVANQVWMPKPGKKYGAIVTPENERFNGTADQLRGISKGASVAIDYADQTWGDSAVRVISSVKVAAPPPAVVASTGKMNGANDEMIFITGVVGRAMGSGQFKAEDIAALTLATYLAYKALQAKKNGASDPQQAPRQATGHPPQGYGDAYDYDPRQ